MTSNSGVVSFPEVGFAALAASVATVPFLLDDSTLEAYLRGLSARDCARSVLARAEAAGDAPSFLDFSHTSDCSIVLHDVRDQYHVIGFLVDYLRNPRALFDATHLPLPLGQKRRLVARYYRLDESVVLALFGLRLSRSDIDQLCAFEADGGLADGVCGVGSTTGSVNGAGGIGDGVEGVSGTPDAYLRHQAECLKHVAKFFCSGYRQRDGVSVPRDLPLSTALERCFGLPPQLASLYATAVFGYEHQLRCACFAGFAFADVAALCSAAKTLCDGSGLLISDVVYAQMSKLKGVLCDARVVQELATAVAGEQPAWRWGALAVGSAVAALREAQTSANAASTATSTAAPGVATGGTAAAAPTSSVLASPLQGLLSSPTMPTATTGLSFATGPQSPDGAPPLTTAAQPAAATKESPQSAPVPVTSASFAGPGAAMAAAGGQSATCDGSSISSDSGSQSLPQPPQQPQHQQQQQHSQATGMGTSIAGAATAGGPGAGGHGYSRRTVTELPNLIRTMGKIAATFASRKDLRELFDQLYGRVIVPLGASLLPPTQGSNSTAADRSAAATKGLMELSTVLSRIVTAFPQLASVAASDHVLLDELFRHYAGFLRLFVVLELSRIGSGSSSRRFFGERF